MTTPSYTPTQLLARVRYLEERLPISNAFPLSHHHTSHRDHWIKWLEGYDGPGYYGRHDHHRDAAYIYNHVQNTGMVVYLAEAALVEEDLVRSAFRAATETSGNKAAVTAAVRRILPWYKVCRRLWVPDSAEKVG